MPTVDYWEMIRPHWERLIIHDGPDAFRTSYEALPPHIRTLLCAHWLQSEVCNGGFQQLFFNSTGVLVPEAIAGYEAVGMPKTAAVIREATSLLGEPYPRDRDSRIRALEAETAGPLLADLDRLTDDFYPLLETENGGWGDAADAYANDAG